jgi:hypothetical protein
MQTTQENEDLHIKFLLINRTQLAISDPFPQNLAKQFSLLLENTLLDRLFEPVKGGYFIGFHPGIHHRVKPAPSLLRGVELGRAKGMYLPRCPGDGVDRPADFPQYPRNLDIHDRIKNFFLAFIVVIQRTPPLANGLRYIIHRDFMETMLPEQLLCRLEYLLLDNVFFGSVLFYGLSFYGVFL